MRQPLGLLFALRWQIWVAFCGRCYAACKAIGGVDKTDLAIASTVL